MEQELKAHWPTRTQGNKNGLELLSFFKADMFHSCAFFLHRILSYKCIFLCVNSEAFMVTLLIKAILILAGTFYCGIASYHMHLQHLCSF